MTADTAGLFAYRPALRSEVLVSPALLRGAATVHLIRDPLSGTAFEVGPKEHFLISRLDGARSLEEIGAEYAETFGRRLGAANWQQLLGLLGTRGLLAGGPEPAAPAEPAKASRTVEGNLLKGRVRLVADAAASTDRLHAALRPLLRRSVLLPLLVLTVGMEALLATHLDELGADTHWLFRQPVALLAVCTLLWLSTALHELAHGVAARHYGAGVGEIGLRWQLPMAIMYCRVDNYVYLSHRRRQLVIAGAGAFMNLLFLLPFLGWWAALSPGDPTRRVLSGLLLLGSAQALVNLVPLPPLDGYTMLGHALRVSNYAPESGRYLRLRLRDRTAAAAYPARARTLYTAYGIGSTVLVGIMLASLVTVLYLLLAS
ncbi:M50 family metallopeptidase [Streptomyces sp. TP-A0874]|uniref:M50 family metallopeptidase n=1 Tax=Streptomyces sp. TP-A0874 TaxID=549819 RepID=UPI000853AFCF|nr:M50 family metallopeptidase [Streptomyces sp. TP-A0874]